MKKAFFVIICVASLSGCLNRVSEAYFNRVIGREYAVSENSIDAILHELQSAKIIMLGETHVTINEQLFVANNLKKLYDAGVRYIFVEGGAMLENALPGTPDYGFYMFWPWIGAGWRYEELLFYQSIIELNNSVPADDQIKLICPEPDDPDPENMPPQVMNYRDSHTAENIISIMDNAGSGEKAVMIFGANHANTAVIKNYKDSVSDVRYDWIPLGYRLKQHYGSAFSSYTFHYLPNADSVNESRLVLSGGLNGLVRMFVNFDGFIVEPEMLYGTFYQYNPTNENLIFIFDLVKEYALYNRNIVPDTTCLPFEEQGQFLMGLYYLKLYFGDAFDYSFWRVNPAKDLVTALNELEQYAFADRSPSGFVVTNRAYDAVLLYHYYMGESYIDEFLDNSRVVVNEDYLIKASEIFPEDLWALYWLAFTSAEKKQYKKAIGYFQRLFADELSLSMEILPLAYRKAALCAGKLRDVALEEEYRFMAERLYNEFRINVEGSYYTGYRF